MARVELPSPKYFVIYASIIVGTHGSLRFVPLSNRGFPRCASMRIIFIHHQLNVYHGILLYHEQIRLRTHDKLWSRAHALILPMLTSKAQGPPLLIPRTWKSGLKSFAAYECRAFIIIYRSYFWNLHFINRKRIQRNFTINNYIHSFYLL